MAATFFCLHHFLGLWPSLGLGQLLKPSLLRLLSVIMYQKHLALCLCHSLAQLQTLHVKEAEGSNLVWRQEPGGLSWYDICLESILLLLTCYIDLRWPWKGCWTVSRDLWPQQFFPELVWVANISEFVEIHLNFYCDTWDLNVNIWQIAWKKW